jgi:hypothetical protein
MDDRHGRLGLAVLGLLALPVVCCALPTLLATGGLAILGGWLGAHGLWLAGSVLIALAAAICGRWWMARRRCAAEPRSSKP